MDAPLYRSRAYTAPSGFTPSIEGPVCDSEGNLYAVNYERRHTIGQVSPQGESSLWIELPEGSTGCGMRINAQDEIFVADHTGHNVLKVVVKTGVISVWAHEPRMHQPNDLAITSQGILFASDPNWSDSTGQLWRIDSDGNVKLLEAHMGTTNGIEVSPDERVLYVNETIQRTIWAYDLSTDHEISNKRLFIKFPDYGLDGMRCDAQGNLYVTRYGKGCIAKVSSTGELLLDIPLIGLNCTNLTFGGEDGRDCYVTVSDNGNIEHFRTEVPGRCWIMWRNDK